MQLYFAKTLWFHHVIFRFDMQNSTLSCAVKIRICIHIFLFWYHLIMLCTWLFYTLKNVLWHTNTMVLHLWSNSSVCCTFCIVSYHPLICIYIHSPSIAPVQTSTIVQRFWSIDSWINSFLFLESGTNIVWQKKLEN